TPDGDPTRGSHSRRAADGVVFGRLRCRRKPTGVRRTPAGRRSGTDGTLDGAVKSRSGADGTMDGAGKKRAGSGGRAAGGPAGGSAGGAGGGGGGSGRGRGGSRGGGRGGRGVGAGGGAGGPARGGSGPAVRGDVQEVDEAVARFSRSARFRPPCPRAPMLGRA